MLEVERRDGGLEQRGQDVAAADDALELVARDASGPLDEPPTEVEVARDGRAAEPRDDVRADLGEPALGGLRQFVVERARDRQLEDAVPEKLQALV
jgi:hypothetical protein